jgi:RHS repeat-associated protein
VLPAVALYQKENPIFGASRLGVYKRQTAVASYEITDHLGNVRAVIQENPNLFSILLSYADYYAFGEQLPSRNTTSDYRYAFQGQELDKETGMEAFQLRLWDGRIGRWLSPDPYGQYDSPYIGMGNNPVNLIDPDGGLAIPDGNGRYYGQKHEDADGKWMWNGSMWEGRNGSSDILAEVIVNSNGGYKNFFMSDLTSDSFKWNALNAGYNGEMFKTNVKVVNFEVENYTAVGQVGGKVSAAGAKGNAYLNFGDDDFGYQVGLEGSAFSAQLESKNGFMFGNNGKTGFSSGVNGSAAVLEGGVTTKVTILGLVYKTKVAGEMVAVHSGYLNTIYYDQLSGNLVIDLQRGRAWGIGGYVEVSLEIPVKKILNLIK